jgi:hypothetical protein
MPQFSTIQQRFTQGELDPSMIARSDIDQYFGALSRALNVITLPQGGFKRRPGLEHLGRMLGTSLTKLAAGTITATAPNGGTASNATDQNRATTLVTTTNISTTNNYVVAHYDLGSLKAIGVLYLYDFLLTTLSSSEFYLQVSTDNSTWVTKGSAISVTAVAKNFTRRVHGSYRYVRLVRIGTTDLGTDKATISGLDVATEGSAGNSRCIDFEFNVDQTYKIVATDKNLSIWQDDTYLIDIYLAELTEARLPFIDWESDADTLVLFNSDFQSITVKRSGANDVWVDSIVTYTNIPTYPFNGTTLTTPAGTVTANATSGFIKLTGAGTTFTTGMVGQYINYIGTSTFGRVFITGFVSTTEIEGNVIETLSGTGTIATGDWELESGYEAVWSSTKGWPRHGRFYQNRLYVDGGRSRPSIAYGSVINDFFNFDFGTGLDDRAIGPLTGGFDDITGFYPGRNLMIFTTKAEYIIPQVFGDPITPKTAAMSRQSSIGSEMGFRPQEIEGGVMYIQRLGASVQEFLYDDTQQAFGNNFVSLLSSHLIASPIDFALRKATSTEEGAYLLIPRADGGLTIANILRSQGITSFVDADTQGKFKSCGVDIADMYFVVEREIDGETINWLERFNNDHYMDASTMVTSGLPLATFTGLDHLEGEECRILADGSLLDNETVINGSITISRSAQDSMEVGLNFTPLVIDLPATLSAGMEQSFIGERFNISEITLRLENTASIVVNGKSLSFRGFGPASGGSPFDSPPPRFTGIKRLMGWLGWVSDAQVTLTQNDPGPMTVLAIKKRINV